LSKVDERHSLLVSGLGGVIIKPLDDPVEELPVRTFRQTQPSPNLGDGENKNGGGGIKRYGRGPKKLERETDQEKTILIL